MDKGLVCKFDKEKGFKHFINIDFAGSCSLDDPLNLENMLSRTSFVILYTGIPILWRSKLQTKIILSTCKAEYIALSTTMREVILLIQLLEDLKVACDAITTPPKVSCKVFEDNQSCITIAESKMPFTHTKYIMIKCHHFYGLVNNSTINIKYVDIKK